MSRKNVHQGAGWRSGCHGRSALRIARAALIPTPDPRGSSGEAPDDPWHPERSVHGLPTHTTRGASRKNVHQGAGGRCGCHGRSALRIARAGVRTGLEQPHGSSGEAPDDPWHPERSVHGLPTHTTRGASRKNVHQGAGGRCGCHGRSALRIARAGVRTGVDSRTGHRAKRPMTRGTRGASTRGLPTHTTRGASRKNVHQGAGRRRGCHGRAARRIARAGVRTGVDSRTGHRAKRPMTRGTRSAPSTDFRHTPLVA